MLCNLLAARLVEVLSNLPKLTVSLASYVQAHVIEGQNRHEFGICKIRSVHTCGWDVQIIYYCTVSSDVATSVVLFISELLISSSKFKFLHMYSACLAT